ncbi:MAG: DNA recombination protein RmuC [Candidatus Ornithospirochaeta sp.]
MEYALILLLAIAIVLLLIVIGKLSRLQKKNGDVLPEEEVSRIRDTIRRDNEESFSRFQSSLDRDMARIDHSLKETGSRIDSSLARSELSFSRFSSSVQEALRVESEKSAALSLERDKDMNANFDRIREENRVSFRDFSEKTEKLTLSVREGMDEIRKGNEEKLREIQNVVDQKLQESLDKRISSSFKAVTENLEKLYQSMGALNTLTSDVKKMNALFSNVKSRGVWGEMQAEGILSDILTQEQWVKNFSPRNNREMVEFAIRMPGKEGEVYLPIDSKFPTSDLERYKEAVDSGDEKKAEAESKNLRDRILSEAKDIMKKYIVPPVTTDFAILFVPSETIYLEAIKMDGLAQRLQDEYRVVITGPNNFAALLNSLRLGFRTMQIEEYTSTIWHLFEDMKKLFSDLSKSIDDSRRHVEKASESLEGARKKKDRISSVLGKIESSAEKAAIDEIDAYYIENDQMKNDGGDIIFDSNPVEK